jgi:hypothetical protein
MPLHGNQIPSQEFSPAWDSGLLSPVPTTLPGEVADRNVRQVNTPPAKAGGFGLRLKAGLIGHSAD